MLTSQAIFNYNSKKKKPYKNNKPITHAAHNLNAWLYLVLDTDSHKLNGRVFIPAILLWSPFGFMHSDILWWYFSADKFSQSQKPVRIDHPANLSDDEIYVIPTWAEPNRLTDEQSLIKALQSLLNLEIKLKL